MKKLHLMILVLIAMTMATGYTMCTRRIKECRDKPFVTIVNKSNRNITFHFYWNYPDTVIGEYNPLGHVMYLAPGDSFVRDVGKPICWEYFFREIREREWIYIFDYDTLRSLRDKGIPWEVVRQTNRGLLERRAIDLEYLHKTNYRVVYPEEY